MEKINGCIKAERIATKKDRFKAGIFYTNDSSLVCTDSSGTGLTSNSLRYFGIWCKENFGKGSFHGLRHTHATMLIESGMGIDYVSKRLGHASMYTTAKFYDDVTQKREAEAIALMDRIL